ncbi:hypothetical protein TNCV_3939681 [Trichonephila clavipes]|uniref:Uncharacterized protein n=1 Tax=Trichonephila clavipes TaxID=2585209 RepID=A0A8X6VVG3_TRICX|nr:hypothetical protein TNCV_3939681 [Trichonephila clavipes]
MMQQFKTGLSNSRVKRICKQGGEGLVTFDTVDRSCVKGILGTGGVMDKCVQMWTRNYGALGQTARVCFGVLCANRTREVKRYFGDLPIRRSEGRVVNTPLVFKKVLFGEKEVGRKREGAEKRGQESPGRENGRKEEGRKRERRRKESRGERE